MEIDKIKEILKESIGAPTAKMDMNLSKILMSMLDSIAQQDYIIIDWEGKQRADFDKKAEVDAQLKNIYLANPLALLSVLFKHYGDGVTENTYYPMLTVESEVEDSSSATIVFYDAFNAEIVFYNFSIE